MRIQIIHDQNYSLCRFVSSLDGRQKLSKFVSRSYVRDPIHVFSNQRFDRAKNIGGAFTFVLVIVARGLSLEEVGRELFVSRNTVKSQATSLYRKLQVSGRADAVRKANRVGLLD